MQKVSYFAILIVFALLSSCSDNTEELVNSKLNFNDEEATVERYEGYNTVTCTLSNIGLNDKIALTCSSDWLTLTTDTLPDDGIVEFYVNENTEVMSREAVIAFALGDKMLSETLTIRQKGISDYNNNADDDKMSDFRIGWGFNAYLEYKSSKSIKGKIIDTNKMKRLDSDTTFLSVQEVARASEDFDTKTAYSLVEMSSKLTQSQSKTKKFLGVRKTTKRYSSICKKELSEQCYGYARLSKIVAQRSIDVGALLHIIETYGIEKLPFTDDFLSTYKKICSSGGNDEESIRQMLNKYGTHLIVNAYAGGSFDFLVSFDRNETSNIEEVIEEKCKNIFGRKTYSYSGSKKIEATSQINNDNTFEICGGSTKTIETLRSSIKNMTNASQLSMQEINDWLASINYNKDSSNEYLDLIDFDFIPIWELFKDASISSAIQNAVLEMEEWSNNQIPLSVLGTDNYSLKLPDINLTEWPDLDTTKVYVVFDPSNQIPVMEMCEEYVPKIRTDRAIFVFYPISNGRTKISQGIFPGDGDGNRPAYLTFSGSDCYVNPVNGYGYNDRLKNIYYLHGNLYAENYGIKAKEIPTNYNENLLRQKKETYYDFTPVHILGLRVIKIGSGYWTRAVKQSMSFQQEIVYKDRLYANILQSNESFCKEYESIYGNDVNTYFQEREKWYLPLASDFQDMITYLDGNLKALFKRQQTGFDADFCGYYGMYDFANNEQILYNEAILYEDYCFMVAKNSLNFYDGKIFRLTPNYTYETYDINSDSTNMYPIRLFRTSYFKYNKDNITR